MHFCTNVCYLFRSAEGESTTDSESSDSDKNEVELLEDDDLASAKRPTTRNTKDKAELVGGLDEASREALAANKGTFKTSFRLTSRLGLGIHGHDLNVTLS